MSDGLTKDCPFCDEQISVNAKKCKHCGETVDHTLRMAEDANSASSQHPNVFMNAGGGGGGASPGYGAAARGNFPHWIHLVITLVTWGVWLPGWILMYIFRDKNRYW